MKEASNRFLCCYFTEAKDDRIAWHELWEEYVLEIGKNTDADRWLGTSALEPLDQGSATFFVQQTGLKLKFFCGKCFSNKNSSFD